mgnify:FL=1
MPADPPTPPDDPLAPSLDPNAGERTLVPWRRSPFPAPWATWFGRTAPLHLEVGFGDGRYTVRRAADAPDDDFVGIEVSGVSVRRALGKLRRTPLPNVRLLKGPAQVAVRQLFAPGSLASVTVNFPDPWPKGRHEEKRLLRRDVFALFADRLAEDGEVRLATDHPDYLAFAEAEADASGLFRSVPRDPPAAVFETKYALKWREQGKPLHYRAFVRTDAPAPAVPLLERPATMPHALFSGTLPDAPPFEKTVVPYEGGHVVLHEVARSLAGDRGDRRLLVRVTVDEPDLTQQLLVEVQARGEDGFIARIGSFGDPLVTPAVRGAVHAVTTWLERDAGLRVEARNY